MNRGANQRIQRGPPCLEPFLLRQPLALGDLFRLRIGLRQLAGVPDDLGNASREIDRQRGRFGDSEQDVVDGNAIAKDRPRVRLGPFDGHAGEAVVPCVAGTILTAMRFRAFETIAQASNPTMPAHRR